MDIGSIFLILGLFLLVALFIARPVIEHHSSGVTREEHETSALLAERDRILTALQELDFDFALGKIPEEDYPAQRSSLLTRGADVLRQLDALQSAVPPDDIEARIEAAIAARQAETAKMPVNSAANGIRRKPAAVASQDDDLEALIASRRRERTGKAAGFCSQCGGPVQKSDRYCPKCGATLS